MLSTITLRLGQTSWGQQLHKGLVQGTPFSAELFGRILDFFLGDAWDNWTAQFQTWINARGQNLRAILYADDILLVATPYEELTVKIRDAQQVLAPLGFQLAMGQVQTAQVAKHCTTSRTD